MICPICKSELKAKTDGYGWYGECMSDKCRLSVGKEYVIMRQSAIDTVFVNHTGLFRTQKALKKFVNQGVVK